jgi:hypothetical protein
MSAPKNGGSAFPQAQRLFDNDTQSWAVHSTGGMFLRDWFAGMAIQGAVAYVNEHEDHYDESLANTAIASYKIADAMLAAREGKEDA